MAIDISAIIGQHLSTSSVPVEETTTSVEESTAVEETTVEETATSVEESTTVEETTVDKSTATAEETTTVEEESTSGLKVDFASVVESKTPVDEPVEIVEDHEFFMSESEQSSVRGAIQSAVIVNAVSI